MKEKENHTAKIGEGAQETSENEEKIYRLAKEMAIPRPEYSCGRVGLYFEQPLFGGVALKAIENTDSSASIILKRGKEKIFDFKDLLPGDFRFVTPSYIIRKHDIRNQEFMIASRLGEWRTYFDKHLISVGDFRNPKEIFALLHEIGHTHQLKDVVSFKKEKEKELMRNATRRTTAEEQKTAKLKELAQSSFLERDAWARALRLVRQIKKETGVDLLEIFPDFDSLKQVIYGALISHRRQATLSVPIDFAEENIDYIRRLYDKERYKNMKLKEIEEEIGGYYVQ